MTTPPIRPAGPGELSDRLGEVMELYRACFQVPPWNEPDEVVDAYPDRLLRHEAAPGFQAFVAERAGHLAAFGYGWPAPATLASANDVALAAAVPSEVAARLVAPAFVLVELMVSPDHRRLGLGRALLDRLTMDHPRAWLLTHPDADARALYASAGWRASINYKVNDQHLLLYLWDRPDG